VILVDTGPLVALFDPRDAHHQRCREALRSFREPLSTTVPVLTELFHVLSPGSRAARNVRDFVGQEGIEIWFLDGDRLRRAFELMERYADHPMDLADASLIVAAEALGTRKVFTVDRRDFAAYRIRRGHREHAVELVG
jgi:predicted nucleic acid-binding protein